MALREFEDADGGRWRVWDTVPVRFAGLGELGGGWLTFDNGTERRRLAPVPEGWADFPNERLALLVRMAHPARDIGRPRAEDGPTADRRRGERRSGDRRHPPS